MIIIGITGKARCGKDTMVEEYFKRPDHPLAQRFAFADAVKHSCAAVFGEPVGKFYEHKEEISERWGISYREMLQKLGTEFARDLISKDFWVNRLNEKIQSSPTSIRLGFVTDVRFNNEANWIHSCGGAVIELLREGVLSLEGTEAEHSSEDGISPDLIDYRIMNNTDVETLGWKLEKLLGTMELLEVV